MNTTTVPSAPTAVSPAPGGTRRSAGHSGASGAAFTDALSSALTDTGADPTAPAGGPAQDDPKHDDSQQPVGTPGDATHAVAALAAVVGAPTPATALVGTTPVTSVSGGAGPTPAGATAGTAPVGGGTPAAGAPKAAGDGTAVGDATAAPTPAGAGAVAGDGTHPAHPGQAGGTTASATPSTTGAGAPAAGSAGRQPSEPGATPATHPGHSAGANGRVADAAGQAAGAAGTSPGSAGQGAGGDRAHVTAHLPGGPGPAPVGASGPTRSHGAMTAAPAASGIPTSIPPSTDASAGAPGTVAGATTTPGATTAPGPDADPGAALAAGAVATPTAQAPANAPAAAAPAAPAPTVAVPLGQQLLPHLATLRTAPDGLYSMVVQVHPEELGPVTISVRLRDGDLHVSLASGIEQARDLMVKALPDLRRDLQQAGLSCSQVHIEAEPDPSSSPAGQHAQPGRGGHDTPQGRHARSWLPAGEPSTRQVPVSVSNQFTSSGVDVRV